MAGKAQLGPVPIFPCEAEGDIRVIVCKALSFIFGGLYRPLYGSQLYCLFLGQRLILTGILI